jgi:hypothetical protein
MKPVILQAAFDRPTVDALWFCPIPNASEKSTLMCGTALDAMAQMLNEDTMIGSITWDADGWIVCRSLRWHTDQGLRPWTAALLARGEEMIVETRSGYVRMKPGDLVIFNSDEEHRCYPVDVGVGYWVIHHFAKKPTPEQARLGIVSELENIGYRVRPA